MSVPEDIKCEECGYHTSKYSAPELRFRSVGVLWATYLGGKTENILYSCPDCGTIKVINDD